MFCVLYAGFSSTFNPESSSKRLLVFLKFVWADYYTLDEVEVETDCPSK